MTTETIGSPPATLQKLAYVADRYRWWIFAAIAFIYAAGFNGIWRVSPDSALYASLGRNLADHHGFTYQGVPHTWAEPGLPLLIAGSFRLAGVDHFGPVLAFLLFCSLAALALNYWLVKLHVDRPTAVLATLLLALCETFYRYAYHLFTDMPFLVGVLAFLVGYERLLRNVPRWRWLSWAMMGLAVPWMAAFRPAVLTFAGAVMATCAWHVIRGPDRRRHLLVGALLLAGLLAFRSIDPRRSSAAAVDYREAKLKTLIVERPAFAFRRAVTEWTPMLLKETVTEGVIGTRIGIDPVAALGIIGLGVALVRRRMLWGAWVAATVAQMVVWLPRERYLLPILPLLLLSILFFAQWMSRRKTKWAAIAAMAVMVIVAGPNLVLVGAFAARQHRRPLPEGPEGPEYRAMETFAERLGNSVSDGDLIVASDARELSYFSGRRVVSLPSAQRVPPTEAQWISFWSLLRSADHVYVVFPDGRRGLLKTFIEDHQLATSESPVLESPRPKKRGGGGGADDEPWTLRKLVIPPGAAGP